MRLSKPALAEKNINQTAAPRRKLQNFPSDTAGGISSMLSDKEICAAPFRDLKASEVPIRHSFELVNDKLIYYNPLHASPHDNRIISSVTKINKILKADIVTIAYRSPSFPLVIAEKKDGKQRFYIN